jgi:hypothetical protein
MLRQCDSALTRDLELLGFHCNALQCEMFDVATSNRHGASSRNVTRSLRQIAS